MSASGTTRKLPARTTNASEYIYTHTGTSLLYTHRGFIYIYIYIYTQADSIHWLKSPSICYCQEGGDSLSLSLRRLLLWLPTRYSIAGQPTAPPLLFSSSSSTTTSLLRTANDQSTVAGILIPYRLSLRERREVSVSLTREREKFNFETRERWVWTTAWPIAIGDKSFLCARVYNTVASNDLPLLARLLWLSLFLCFFTLLLLSRGI